DGALREAASAPGLRHADTLAFPTMIAVGDEFRLGDLRALGDGFPLRGAFRLLDATGRESDAVGAPAPGTAWLTRAGAEALGARLGDEVGVGDSRLRLVALVAQEPDAALDYFNAAPRVFVNLADVP